MANETDECPWCGSGKPYVYDKGTQWDCLAWKMADGSEIRTEECKRREATTLRQQLATVTAERDKHLEIIKACRDGFNNLEPHGKTILDFMNVWLDQSNERAEKAEAERDELRRRIDDAPVGVYRGLDQHFAPKIQMTVDVFREGQYEPGARVRLVRDDQPGEES